MLSRPVRASVLCLALTALGVLGGLARPADANGRLPATSTITFRQGHETDIAVGLTFGLLISHDGGKTWGWMCEAAVGYGGTYDPVYVYSSSGALFATTFNGLSVMRDTCTFGATPEGKSFVSASSLDPGGNFYYGAAQVTDTKNGLAQDFKIYKSANDLATLPTGIKPGDAGDTNVWWQSIEVAPGNPQIVYLSGYRYIPNPAGAGTVRDHLLFRSNNAGGSWTALNKTGLVLMPNSVIHIAGIWKDDATHLYARVEFIDNTTTDAFYVSTDSGATWSEIDRAPNPFSAFAVRAAVNSNGKHDLVDGTASAGTRVSHDDGAHWTALANGPHINCLVENAAGELWACTQNYGVGQMVSDDAGIMKTTDLATWTKVLRYQDLTDAIACAAGTPQAMTCATSWCAVCAQLGCTASASYACPAATEAIGGDPPAPGKGGCCDTGGAGSSGGPLALALVVATVVLRRRRRP
jgi:MYXO-CTERM domain-containing protein